MQPSGRAAVGSGRCRQDRGAHRGLVIFVVATRRTATRKDIIASRRRSARRYIVRSSIVCRSAACVAVLCATESPTAVARRPATPSWLAVIAVRRTFSVGLNAAVVVAVVSVSARRGLSQTENSGSSKCFWSSGARARPNRFFSPPVGSLGE